MHLKISMCVVQEFTYLMCSSTAFLRLAFLFFFTVKGLKSILISMIQCLCMVVHITYVAVLLLISTMCCLGVHISYVQQYSFLTTVVLVVLYCEGGKNLLISMIWCLCMVVHITCFSAPSDIDDDMVFMVVHIKYVAVLLSYDCRSCCSVL